MKNIDIQNRALVRRAFLISYSAINFASAPAEQTANGVGHFA